MHHMIDIQRIAPPPALSKGQLSAGRAELNRQRIFRIQQLADLVGDTSAALAAGDEPRLQVTYALRRAATSAVIAIDAALRRLREGSYGTCERCAEHIPWERLEVLPMTGLCTHCQFMAESGHADLPARGPLHTARRP